MPAQVIIGGQPTSLKLFVGVGTLFEADNGPLCCRDFFILAEDKQMAVTCLAVNYPLWDIQCLTCVSDAPWFAQIILDENCPQISRLADFIIRDLQAEIASP